MCVWREGGGGSRPWYHICAIFCTNPSESALPTQRGCVVTPRTRRTLPSQNSTFVMSCRQGCCLGADWPARFYCPTTRLTFEPHRPSLWITQECTKRKMTPPWHVHMWRPASHMFTSHRVATDLRIPFCTQTPPRQASCPSWQRRRKMPQWLQSAPTKMQSSFSTRGIFIFN